MLTAQASPALLETAEIQARPTRPSPSPSPRLQNLLVAYDFSGPACRALAYAREFARIFRSRITLASVETPDEVAEDLESDDQAAREAAATRNLEQVAYALHINGIRSSAVHRVGSPTDLLVQLASQLKPDLLFMGAYNHSAADRATLGSTTEFLLRSLTCPTLTIGPSVPILERDSLSLSCAVYASSLPRSHSGLTSHPELTSPAEAFVRNLAVRAPLHIHIVHVEPSRSLLSDCGHLTELQNREVTIANRFRASGIPTCWTIQYGDQPQHILDQAHKVNADLIVFGIAHPATDPLQMGILTTLIRNAHCPVLTVHGTA